MCILCGTDFSPHAAKAADLTAALATRLGEPVKLVHVREPLTSRELLSREEGAFQRAIHARLQAEANRLREMGVAVDEEVRVGVPDEELVACARTAQARLVVVGGLGRRSPAQWLLGSIAERTVQTSTVPVLIARGEDGFAAWSRGERALRVMVGADCSATSDAAVRWVAELLRVGPCEAIMAHIYWPPEELRRLGLRPPLELGESRLEIERVLARDLTARVEDLLTGGGWRVLIRAGLGRPADHLVRLAEQERVDLLVVGTHQRTALGRLRHGAVSQGVLHSAPMAVVCVPLLAPVERGTARVPDVRRVLAPTDLSELGDRAVPHAYSVLGPGGVVALLHVIDPGTLPNPLYPGYVPGRAPTGEEQQQQHADLAARLQALIPEEAAARGIETQVEIVEAADVTQAIAGAAERFDADLICLSSHGRSGISRLIAGSVAQAVMAQSPRPLLVIRPPRTHSG